MCLSKPPAPVWELHSQLYGDALSACAAPRLCSLSKSPATSWRSFHITSGFFFANARKSQNWIVWQRIGVSASTVAMRSRWLIIASTPK